MACHRRNSDQEGDALVIARDTTQSWIDTHHNTLFNFRGPNCDRYHRECDLNYCGMMKRERCVKWEQEYAKCVFIGLSCTCQSCECQASHCGLTHEEIHDNDTATNYIGMHDEG